MVKVGKTFLVKGRVKPPEENDKVAATGKENWEWGADSLIPVHFIFSYTMQTFKNLSIYHFNGLKSVMGNTFSDKIYVTHKIYIEFTNTAQIQERFWGL